MNSFFGLSNIIRASLFLVFACVASSCDGAKEFVVNCNPHAVRLEGSTSPEIKSYSKFAIFSGGTSAKGDTFVYPHGSLARPKIVNPVDVYEFDKNFGSDDFLATKSLCKKFGPGVIVIG